MNASYRVALCLSGGGFRATLFHLGSLIRLNELGILQTVHTITSVSGGSITNGILATRWNQLNTGSNAHVFNRLSDVVGRPLIDFCRKDLRTEVLLWDRVNPINWLQLLRSDYSVTDRLAIAYAENLDLDVPLSQIPNKPKFIFCAANLNSGVSWEFQQNSMGDYQTGSFPVDDVMVAKAVAASSAYPLTFPPLMFELDGERGTSIAKLTDGGVYDNLGLEPVVQYGGERHSHDVVLVSDAGRPFDADQDVKPALVSRLTRSLDVIWNQVGALRKRFLIQSYLSAHRGLRGAYWGLGSNVDNYELHDAPGFRGQSLELLRSVRTDLDSFTPGEIACLINHGYAMANVAIKRWSSFLIRHEAPFQWPYPEYTSDSAVQEALQNSSERGIWSDLWDSINK